MKVVRTRRGARLVDGRDVLSDVLARPGPTHGLFDILAACIATLGRGDRFAMLGFAGGGVVAPLRALGFAHRIDAVDLSRAAEPLFRELSSDWAGDVRLAEMDAAAWLRASRRRFDVILEDLTVPGPGGAVKPEVSLEVLPRLMRSRLRPGGAAVVNTLPLPGMPYGDLLRQLGAPFPLVHVLDCDDYENRVLIAGQDLEPRRVIAADLRAALLRLGSRQAARWSLRGLGRRSLA